MNSDDEHKREAFAAFAMIGLLAGSTPRDADDLAKAAVQHAEALIRALDATA